MTKKYNKPILSYGLIILKTKNIWLNKINNTNI